MLKTTLAGLRARTARTLLSSIAVVLGVAFVSGTLILGNALDAGVRADFARQTRGVDAEVSLSAGARDKTALTTRTIDQLRLVPGVAGADGRLTSDVPLVRSNGKAKPVYVSALESTPSLREFDLSSGRFPDKPGEIAVEATTAQTTRLSVGQKVSVLGQDGKPSPLTVVGTYGQGTSKVTMFGDQAVMTPVGLFPLVENPQYYQVVLAAQSGVSQQQLVDRIKASLNDPGLSVRTGDQLTAQTLREVGQGSGGLTSIMLVFAVIALIVAAMVIYNTFTILVAQRTRELALLRCIGAGRGQVFRSVLLEALVMGLFASVAGLAAGVGLAAVLQSSIGSMFGGIGDGPAQLPITLSVVLAAFGVGVLVTVVSAALPALRATRVAPLAALRTVPDSQDEVRRTSMVRMASFVILALGGAALCYVGISAAHQASTDSASGQGMGFILTGVGAMILLAAVIVLGPIIVGPVNRVLGALPKLLFGVPARLATGNAVRNPRRTAATTAALMIGMTIVTMVTVVATSGKQSVGTVIDTQYPVDYTITSSVYEHTLPPSLVDQLGRLDQVAAVYPIERSNATIGGKEGSVTGINPGSIGTTLVIKSADGDMGGVATGQLAVNRENASYYGLKLGQRVPVSVPGGKPMMLTVAAIFESQSYAGTVVSQATLAKLAPEVTGYDRILVKIKSGVSPADSQAAVDKVTQPVPIAQVDSAAAQKEEVVSQIDSLLGVMWALIGLTVVIAMFGIANTLSLSVLERTRESALLRALGLTRSQLREMLLIESVLIALVGAVIGMLLGGGFARLLVEALSSDRLQLSYAIPYGQLGVMLAGAVLAAILAAVLPARRAARTPVVAGMAEV